MVQGGAAALNLYRHSQHFSMMVTINITNPQLYHQRVARVDTQGLIADTKTIFNGSIQIHTQEGSCIPFYGFIEADDFKARFGFVLVMNVSPVLSC